MTPVLHQTFFFYSTFSKNILLHIYVYKYYVIRTGRNVFFGARSHVFNSTGSQRDFSPQYRCKTIMFLWLSVYTAAVLPSIIVDQSWNTLCFLEGVRQYAVYVDESRLSLNLNRIYIYNSILKAFFVVVKYFTYTFKQHTAIGCARFPLPNVFPN